MNAQSGYSLVLIKFHFCDYCGSNFATNIEFTSGMDSN